MVNGPPQAKKKMTMFNVDCNQNCGMKSEMFFSAVVSCSCGCGCGRDLKILTAGRVAVAVDAVSKIELRLRLLSMQF